MLQRNSPSLPKLHTFDNSTLILTSASATAYWIAFGPHGPRAEDPAGTGSKIFWGVVSGVAASVAIFGAIRLAAKPAPHTMTKEWQEASNEILKVSSPLDECASQDAITGFTDMSCVYRSKKPIPSLVSQPRATRVPARSSLLPRVLKTGDHLKTLTITNDPQNPTNRIPLHPDYQPFIRLLLFFLIPFVIEHHTTETSSPGGTHGRGEKKWSVGFLKKSIPKKQEWKVYSNVIIRVALPACGGLAWSCSVSRWCKYCTTTMNPKFSKPHRSTLCSDDSNGF
jgi:hypothetical protein